MVQLFYSIKSLAIWL